MSDLGPAIRFAAGLYRQRAAVAFAGYARRDPLALLNLKPGRTSPYPIYEQLRARGPLVPTRQGNWSSTSYQVCSAVLRDRRFGVGPEPEEVADEPSRGLSFLGMDPPDHTRLRRLAQPAFSPRAVAGYAGPIEAKVGELLDTAAAAGDFDLVAGFAAALPIAVITEMFGIADADSAEFSRFGVALGSALDGVRSMRHAAQLLESRTVLHKIFEDLFEERRRAPGDDVVSRIVAAEGSEVQPDEMLPMCTLLLVAGFETTVNLIGNTVLALLAHRDQWEALCADPAGLAARAVEETLRWDPPVHMTGRVALEPAEVAGREIRKGQEVITLLGATGRDPEVFDRPAEFDIHREPGADTLAFSGGIHYCLGKPLALLEATTAIKVLAQRLPGLTRTGPVQRRNATIIRGPISVPVSAGSRRAAPPAPVAVAGKATLGSQGDGIACRSPAG